MTHPFDEDGDELGFDALSASLPDMDMALDAPDDELRSFEEDHYINPEKRAAESYMQDIPVYFEGGHILFDQDGWIEVFYENRGVTVETQIDPEYELTLWRMINVLPSEKLDKAMHKLRIDLSKLESSKGKKQQQPGDLVLDVLVTLASK